MTKKTFKAPVFFGAKASTEYNNTDTINDADNATWFIGAVNGNDAWWRCQQRDAQSIMIGRQGGKGFQIYSSPYTVYVTADKFIGAATSLVEENIYTATNFGTSDKRLKRSIKKIDEVVTEKAVDSINLNRSFIYKKSGVKGYGPVAQDLEEVFPELVYTNDRGIKGVNNTALLHLQIQGLYQKIQELQDQLAQTSFKEKIGIWSRLKQALKKWLLP